MPTTSKPCSLTSAAVTELSTPPDMATTMRAGVVIAKAWLAVHHVARRRRQLHGEAVELFAHDDLAAQARGLRQAEGKVEHVLLVLGRFLQKLVPFGIDDDMTGRAGERTLARALDVDAVLMRDLEHGKTQRRFDLATRPVAFDESHFRHELRPRLCPVPSGGSARRQGRRVVLG